MRSKKDDEEYGGTEAEKRARAYCVPFVKRIIPDLAYCDCSEESRAVLFDEVGSSTGSAASGDPSNVV